MASASLYCPQCGRLNEPQSTFCANCGSPLPTPAAETVRPQSPQGRGSGMYSSPNYPAGSGQSSPSYPNYPTGNDQPPSSYPKDEPYFPSSTNQTGHMQSSPSYPTDGPRVPPPYQTSHMPPSPPTPRKSKKGLIAIIAAVVIVLLVGGGLFVAFAKSFTHTIAVAPTATPTLAPTATPVVPTPTASPAVTVTTTTPQASMPTPASTATTSTSQTGLPCNVDVGTWTGGSADWKTYNNTLLDDGTNNNGPYNSGPSIVAPCQSDTADNYSVVTKIQVTNGNNGGCFGISVRGNTNTSSNNWQGYLAGVGDCGNLSGAYLSGPNYTNDNAQEQATFAPGSGIHTYRVDANGNVFKFYIDGSLLLTLTDNRYLTGSQVGLWCKGVQLQVTSFQVTAL